jgi:hypothetical protein
MEVDLEAIRRVQDHPDRSKVLGHREPERRQGIEHGGERVEFHHEVDVVMGPRHLSEQCVHAPAAVEPHAPLPSLEGIEDHEHLVGREHRARIRMSR